MSRLTKWWLNCCDGEKVERIFKLNSLKLFDTQYCPPPRHRTKRGVQYTQYYIRVKQTLNYWIIELLEKNPNRFHSHVQRSGKICCKINTLILWKPLGPLPKLPPHPTVTRSAGRLIKHYNEIKPGLPLAPGDGITPKCGLWSVCSVNSGTACQWESELLNNDWSCQVTRGGAGGGSHVCGRERCENWLWIRWLVNILIYLYSLKYTVYVS